MSSPRSTLEFLPIALLIPSPYRTTNLTPLKVRRIHKCRQTKEFEVCSRKTKYLPE